MGANSGALDRILVSVSQSVYALVNHLDSFAGGERNRAGAGRSAATFGSREAGGHCGWHTRANFRRSDERSRAVVDVEGRPDARGKPDQDRGCR